MRPVDIDITMSKTPDPWTLQSLPPGIEGVGCELRRKAEPSSGLCVDVGLV